MNDVEIIKPCPGQLSYFDVLDIKNSVMNKAHELARTQGIKFNIQHRGFIDYRGKKYEIKLFKGELEFQGQI